MNLDPLLNNKINSIIELYSSGQVKESLIAINTLIDDHPKESLLHNISGVIFKSTGQLEMAVKSFSKAVSIKPDFADAHYNLGLTLQELNQLDDAVKSYEVTLDIQSDYAKAHNNLGTIYKEFGQIDDAVKSFKHALKFQPDFAEACNNLGNILTDLNQLDDAISYYEKALKIQPDYFEVHNNLGNNLYELGRAHDAIKFYEKAIALNPQYAEAYNNLATSLNSVGHLYDALKLYKKAVDISPEFAEAHNNLGVTLNELSQLHEAILSYERAIAINPEYYEAYNNLAGTFSSLGQFDKAIKFFKQAISINSDFADGHNNLGNIFQDLGKLDEALDCYVNALAIEPDNPQFHRNLSTLKHYKDGDTQLIHMQRLFTNNLNSSDRISLCFGLAKAYADLEKKDELFKVLDEGNRLRKEEMNYSIEKDLNNHSLLKNIFKTSIKVSTYKPLTIRPIFIVGMPRSGTTLIEQIISSHHKVYGAGELPTLDNLIAPIVENFLLNNNSPSEEDFKQLRKTYSNLHLSNLDKSETFITDKMPTNFENIGFILKAFPEAKIIHLKRDAMAVCWSIYQRYFPSEVIGFPYDMEDLSKFYNSYIEMMAFWHELFPDRIYDMSYEELTINTEEETRKLLDYCELKWDKNCLNFHTNERAIKTASSFQVKEKIYQGSSEVWKKYKTQLAPLISSLGYNK